MMTRLWRAAARRLDLARLSLIENARDVLRKSWSVRFMALSGALQTAYLYWPNLDFLPWWSSLAVLGLACLARFVAQRGLSLPAENEVEP